MDAKGSKTPLLMAMIHEEDLVVFINLNLNICLYYHCPESQHEPGLEIEVPGTDHRK